MSVNKLERLLNLTAVLLDTRRPLTAEEIRRKVEGYPPAGSAFHRAFERDKDDLRVLGIPLKVEKVKASDPPIDGYRIDPDEYYLPDPDLAPDELAALHLASLTVRLDGLGDREALWKLGGLDPTGAGEKPPAATDVGLTRDVVASLPADPALIPIFQAITERRVITFGYRGEVRVVDPWRLDFHRGRWYLTGFDRVRSGERNFRLDRIEGEVVRTGDDADIPDGDYRSPGPRQAWEIGQDEPVMAELRIDADHVVTARRQLGPEVESRIEPDGSEVFAIPVANRDAFRTFILGFLDHAELLSPPEWRADIVNWLGSIATASEGVS
jgi:proteasome accessory factor B